MESIEAELDVIRLIEEELKTRQEVDKLTHQLKCLKKLAHSIEDMINKGERDCHIHKATNILCKYLGILWGNVFNMKD